MSTSNFLEILTVPMAAGEVRNFMVSGAYFEVIDAASPITVRLTDKFGAVRGKMQNAEASFYLRASEFDVIEITSAAAQVIRIAYGSAEAGTRRTAGIVTVVDGGRERTRNGVAYMGGTTIAPGAGNFAVVQLWNPPASGRNLVISKALAQVTNADGITFHIQNASIGGALIPIASKLGGGGASAGELRRAALAAPIATGQIFGANLPVSGFLDYSFSEPIVLPQGFGMVFIASTVNNSSGASFEFTQEPA